MRKIRVLLDMNQSKNGVRIESSGVQRFSSPLLLRSLAKEERGKVFSGRFFSISFSNSHFEQRCVVPTWSEPLAHSVHFLCDNFCKFSSRDPTSRGDLEAGWEISLPGPRETSTEPNRGPLRFRCKFVHRCLRPSDQSEGLSCPAPISADSCDLAERSCWLRCVQGTVFCEGSWSRNRGARWVARQILSSPLLLFSLFLSSSSSHSALAPPWLSRLD